jgi:DHA2 family multidrug resistance protein
LPGDNLEALAVRYGPAYKWIVTFTGMIAAMTTILSSTMVNVAVPSIMGSYGVGQDDAQWMATAFLATMTASQLLGAWVIAAIGHRAGYLGAVGIFIAGSFLCALAPNIDVLIAGRVVQGFAAGIVQPLAMVMMFRVFPPHKRGLAMSVYGMGIMIAPILGPVVGGLTIDLIGWRELFYIPLPVTVVALALGSIFFPGRDPGEIPPFDWTGYAFLVGAIVCLMTFIANGQRDGWSSDAMLVRAVIGLACASAFVFTQMRSSSPLLDFTLFRHTQFAAAALLGFVFGAGNFASTYAIPVFVQTVQYFTPTLAGVVTVPAGVVLMFLFPVGGRLVDALPVHYLAMGGLLVFAAGTALLNTADAHTTFWTLAWYVIVGRVGLSLLMPTINVSALRALPPEQLNNGSGTINFIRLMGGACGVNGLVVFMEQRSEFHSAALTATQTPENLVSRELLARVAEMLSAGGVPDAVRDVSALHYLGRVVEAQATTLGFQDGFMLITAVFLAALVPAAILGRSVKRRR